MAPDTPDFQSIVDGLEKLKRQNRTLKRVGLLGLTAVAALLLMGQAAPGSRTIEAEKFVLIDSAGMARAELSMILEGPNLVMYDAKGNPRAELVVTSDGPRLDFANEAGKIQTVLTAYKGYNGVLTRNREGELSTFFGVDETGPTLEIRDTGGKAGIRLWSTDQGPHMSFRDAAGMERAALYLKPDSGLPCIALYDQRGKMMTALLESKSGPMLGLNDLDENLRVQLAVENGTPVVLMRDAKGNLTWSTPIE
jgi:hypothetical protein